MKPKIKVGKKKKILWNTNKEGGWLKYYEKTNVNDELDHLVHDSNDIDVDTFNNKIDKVMSKLKYQCFGKVSVKESIKEERAVLKIQSEKLNTSVNEENKEKIDDIDSRLAEAIDAANKKNLELEKASLRNILENKGRSAAIFNLKDRVLGSRKTSQEPTVIIDKVKGEIYDTPATIKKHLYSTVLNCFLTNHQRKNMKQLFILK